MRNYRKYFKPVLCYLEGAWTISEKLEESFFSDRHFLDASSWFDMQEKVRYTSYTGGKSNKENFSYLPTTIMNMINGTLPQIAQWNYRILCHPLKRDVPLNRFRVVDDLMARMANKKTLKEHERTRAARFTVNPSDTEAWVDGVNNYGLIDDLMGEIPGKDNYAAALYDDAFDSVSYPYNATDDINKLNVGYYHRWMRVASKDAMGRTTRHRGYADANLYMAMTTQSRVAGVELDVCQRWRARECTRYEQKWTYAIPLEIIYMTPLYKWNPYELEYKGPSHLDLGKTVWANGRHGSVAVKEKAFLATNSRVYYQTPYELFVSGEQGTTAADTVRHMVGVLDQSGEIQKVKASGTRIFLPFIPGVGSMRTRYPIVPVHGEGSGVWKELEALKDIVLEPKTYIHMFHENWRYEKSEGVELLTGKSQDDGHVHRVVISAREVDMLKEGRPVLVETGETNGHSHEMTIRLWKNGIYVMVGCDAAKYCFDRHDIQLPVAPSETGDEGSDELM